MKIEIPKQSIDSNVMTLTAVIGRNRKDIQNIAITPDNLPALGPFMAEAVTEAENELRRHLSGSNLIAVVVEETSITFSIDAPHRMDPSTYNQISSTFEQYISQYVTGRWLSSVVAASNLAETYISSAAGQLNTLKLVLCQRAKFELAEDAYSDRAADNAEVSAEQTDNVLFENRLTDNSFIQDKESEGISYTKRISDNVILGNESKNQTSYSIRASDCSMIGSSINNSPYKYRRRDVNPIKKKWPDGVMQTQDEKVPTDKNNIILTAKQ